jgi:hypothetical protein
MSDTTFTATAPKSLLGEVSPNANKESLTHYMNCPGLFQKNRDKSQGNLKKIDSSMKNEGK